MYRILLLIVKPRIVFDILLGNNLLLHPINRLIYRHIYEQNSIVERRDRYIVEN